MSTDQTGGLSGPGLRRDLGWLDATCVVIGAIVGVGIFFTPSRVASLAGSAEFALLAWALGGAIALLGALTFAELGSRYSRSGAQYDILCDSYGPMTAFLFVFCNATAIQAGAIAIIAVICAQNLGIGLSSQIPAPGVVLLLSILLIVALGMANVAGVRWGSRIQNVTVAIKLAALAAIATLALFAPDTGANEGGMPTPESPTPGFRMIYAALVPCLFTFGGWQHALWIGGEVKNPQRTVPRAVLAGVLTVVAFYLLINWAYLDLLGHAGVARSQAVAADAVASVLPGWAHRATALAVALSAFGVLNAQLLSGPRLIFAMARDGRFFPLFAKIGTNATPLPAIVLLGTLALALLCGAYIGSNNPVGAVDQLLTGVVFIDGLFFALTGAALIVLRRRESEVRRGVRAPLFPLVPLLFVCGELSVVAGAYVDPAVRTSALIGVAWIVGAALLYVWRFRRNEGPGDLP